MKKTLFFSIALALGLSACTGDYTDWADPIKTEPGEPQNVTLSVAPVEQITMEQVTADSVQVFLPTTVESTLQPRYELQITNTQTGKFALVPTTAEGMVAKKDLKDAVEQLFGKRQELRTMQCQLLAWAEFDGVTTMTTSNTFQLAVLPEIPPINYWIYGKQNNRDNKQRTLPLMPVSAANQAVTTYFSGKLDTKVLTDDYFNEPLDAYVYGVMGTQAQTPQGEVLAGNGGYISSPQEGWYTLSFDFAAYTYKFTRLDNQSPAEYATIGLIGLGGDWNNDIVMQEVQTNKSAWRSHCWYTLDLTVPADTEGKFRADAGWAVSWGASHNVQQKAYGQGVQDGANITVPAGTYDVYFNDITGEFLFLTK